MNGRSLILLYISFMDFQKCITFDFLTNLCGVTEFWPHVHLGNRKTENVGMLTCRVLWWSGREFRGNGNCLLLFHSILAFQKCIAFHFLSSYRILATCSPEERKHWKCLNAHLSSSPWIRSTFQRKWKGLLLFSSLLTFEKCFKTDFLSNPWEVIEFWPWSPGEGKAENVEMPTFRALRGSNRHFICKWMESTLV